MLFNSYIFVLLFLPMCIVGYFGLNHFKHYKCALWFLLGMSLWFYGYFNPSYLGVILSSILINYFIYRLLSKIDKAQVRKIIMLTGVLINISILFYFKYYDFFITNINALFRTDYVLQGIILPLGISFFTFQQLSFVMDAYHGEVKEYDFLHYASFVAFFPQLIAGPIVTHDELVPQFMDESKKKFDWDNFSSGMYIFVLGLGKKVLLADTFGGAVNYGFSNISQLNTLSAIIVMLSYTLQIYFDFSGYCDMAIGIGKILNIDLPLNFNSPYKALTITEFWDRWHMTLTRFFTKYVYIPLGGNRNGNIRTYVNIMIVFTISGIWHGANWTFILWGVLHGVFSVITRRFKKFFDRLHPLINWIITFSFINVTWVLFRGDTIKDALRLYRQILRFDFGGLNAGVVNVFQLPELEMIYDKSIMWMVLFFAVSVLLLFGDNAYEKMKKFEPTRYNAIITITILLWCIFSFGGESTFLYFNF